MPSTYPKDWALKWIEGSMVSYIAGRTSLNILLGRIKRAIEDYGVDRSEVLAIIDVIERSPVYLPSLSQEEKGSRLEPLRRALENM
jgi:hypothetical protein